MGERQLELFKANLPSRPYCADDFRFGVKIRSAMQAVRFRYIQPNNPWSKRWIVLDLDYDGAAVGWRFMDAPAPNIIARNPENGHAHLFYGLDVPVRTDQEQTHRAARYCAAVEYALMQLLHGDPAYAGLLAKNPLCPAWDVETAEEWAYDLDTLSRGLELPKWEDGRRRLPDYGLGRNCTLFEVTRRYAYRRIRAFWGASYDAYLDDLLVHVAFENNNRFASSPLHYGEFKAIAKSVAKWTWQRFTPEEFSRIQRERSRKENERRRAEAAERAQRLFAFMAENPEASINEIAELSGLHRSTVWRYRNRVDVAGTISESSGLPRAGSA